MRDRSERLGGLVEHAFDVLLDRAVALDGDRLAAGRFDRRHHLGGGLGVALVADRHVIAALTGHARGRRADAAAAADNEKHWTWHKQLPLECVETLEHDQAGRRNNPAMRK